MVCRLDPLRESRRLPACLGRSEARDGQSDEGNLAKLDFSDIRHRRRRNRENLDIGPALAHHARYRMDVAANLSLGCDDCHLKLRGHLLLAVDIYAM